MDAAKLIQAIGTSPTRSGERLLILSAFVNSLPAEKMTKLKSIKIDWQTMEEELVPTLNVEFFE